MPGSTTASKGHTKWAEPVLEKFKKAVYDSLVNGAYRLQDPHYVDGKHVDMILRLDRKGLATAGMFVKLPKPLLNNKLKMLVRKIVGLDKGQWAYHAMAALIRRHRAGDINLSVEQVRDICGMFSDIIVNDDRTNIWPSRKGQWSLCVLENIRHLDYAELYIDKDLFVRTIVEGGSRLRIEEMKKYCLSGLEPEDRDRFLENYPAQVKEKVLRRITGDPTKNREALIRFDFSGVKRYRRWLKSFFRNDPDGRKSLALAQALQGNRTLPTVLPDLDVNLFPLLQAQVMRKDPTGEMTVEYFRTVPLFCDTAAVVENVMEKVSKNRRYEYLVEDLLLFDDLDGALRSKLMKFRSDGDPDQGGLNGVSRSEPLDLQPEEALTQEAELNLRG